MPPPANVQNINVGHRCWIDWPVWEIANRFSNAPRTTVQLSVCMDEGVMLVFSGIGTPHATIVVATSEDDIRWDETPLWSASDASSGS